MMLTINKLCDKSWGKRNAPNNQFFLFILGISLKLLHPDYIYTGHLKYYLLFVALLAPAFSATAEPASKVAWTPSQLKAIQSGDPSKGQTLANGCSACHGTNGISNNPLFPSLAGQMATYTYKQLMDYQNDKRLNSLMTPIAKTLNQKDFIDLAAWFASLPRARYQAQTKDLTIAEQLVSKGDGKRTLPPCFVCHGANGQGEKMDIPALAGQQPDYLAETLRAYKNGTRHNDIYSRMRLIARQLSDREIEELAHYYNQLSKGSE